MFVSLEDFQGEAVSVIQADVDYANTYVNNFLKSMGIDPAELSSVPAVLKELAKLVALERACVRLSQTEESVYLEKAKSYGKLRQELEERLSSGAFSTHSSPITLNLGRA